MIDAVKLKIENKNEKEFVISDGLVKYWDGCCYYYYGCYLTGALLKYQYPSNLNQTFKALRISPSPPVVVVNDATAPRKIAIKLSDNVNMFKDLLLHFQVKTEPMTHF